MNPYRFINMYKTGYNLGLTDKGKAYWVHLTARNPKNSVPEIYILIDKKTSHPETIKMRRGKEWTTVTVRNFKAGRLADSVFTFNAKEFPHAEVVDLRYPQPDHACYEQIPDIQDASPSPQTG